MGRADVDAFLAHYTSDTYDPLKAHEYYVKNRELKGRDSTKGMSEVQKEAVSYSKNQIGIAKKTELAKTQEEHKARLEGIRARMEETRTRITDKLNAAIEGLLAEADKPLQNVRQHVIPPNANPAKKALLQRQNALLRQAAGQTAARARQDAGEKINTARQDAGAQIKKLGTDMKAAVETARAAYDQSKKDLIAKYDKAQSDEFNNIRTQLPGKAPKAVKPKAAPKPKTKRAPRKRKENLQNDSESRL